jgi:hypothetical protein
MKCPMMFDGSNVSKAECIKERCAWAINNERGVLVCAVPAIAVKKALDLYAFAVGELPSGES